MRRRGLTLIELLVVIAIIAVLIGLRLLAVQAAGEVARPCSSADRNTAPLHPTNQSTGSSWYSGNRLTGTYNHIMPPNTWSCEYFEPIPGTGGFGVQGAYTASSRHPGGVNTLFADGSVHFVKQSVAKEDWWALGTRNGSEVISSSDY